jgi:hypothetical protein
MKLKPKQAIALRCPTCGAAPGQKCELSTGLPRFEAHQARRLAAGERKFGMAESEKTPSAPLLRRGWHVVAEDLENEHAPVRRAQLVQETVG